MKYKIGDTVIYPHHGAACIEEISEKIFRGKKRMYLTLRILHGDLVIQVPEDSLPDVGVREVSNDEELERVFDILREEDVDEPSNWSRRYKANGEKLTSGDVNKVAEVVRDLTRRDHSRGLSAGEKRMLTQAREILGSEVALARDLNDEEADSLLDEVMGFTHDTAEKAVKFDIDDLEDEMDEDSAYSELDE